ncbi:MAG: bifunctional riboflavin kinase/FAD synthetase [Prevotella sp.]|nr:bifunctional riboflavin kinase/FAD synthetase [Prevotella sp.]
MRVISADGLSDMMPCAATIGFFDGVHLGHQFLIRHVCDMAAAEGLVSTVITFAVHPRQVVQEGFRPELLASFEEKLSLLAATGVDECMILPFDAAMASMSAYDFMKQVLARQMNVRHLVVGYDHRFGHDCNEGFNNYVRYGEELGIRVERAEEVDMDGECVSSSLIRACLHRGEVEKANHYLGHPYTLTGTVIGGEQQGRRMGFPTANLSLSEPCLLIPATGVYAVDVRIDGEEQWRPAMMNIGTRPTFHGDHVTLETHILHFHGDLYGRILTVAFRRHIRPERQFDSPEALAEQLKEDIKCLKKPHPQPLSKGRGE